MAIQQSINSNKINDKKVANRNHTPHNLNFGRDQITTSLKNSSISHCLIKTQILLRPFPRFAYSGSFIKLLINEAFFPSISVPLFPPYCFSKKNYRRNIVWCIDLKDNKRISYCTVQSFKKKFSGISTKNEGER